MSNFSSTYPAIRPTYQIDFSNGKRIPPNATFTRSDSPIDASKAAASAVHYWSNEKHLSSENLLTYSNPNNAAWNESNGASVTTNAAAAPDGTTTASSIVEDSANSQHRTFASINATSGQVYTLVAYLKGNGRTIAQVATSGASAAANVEFDLSSSGTATTRSGSPANSSISQIGSTGWYKCSFQVTAGSTATLYLNVYLCDSANSNSYTGDGTSGVYAWGFNLSTTGQLVHEDTTTQIHREYAPTLKSVATAGQPRFEYDPSTDGQSMGCLIESQATNLNAQSDDVSNWNGSPGSGLGIESNVALAPSGELIADKLTPNDGATGSAYATVYFSATSGQQYTHSFYAKADGQRYITMYGRTTNGVFDGEVVHFDLQTGTVASTSGSGVTAACESAGNGWHRCITTLTAGATATGYNRVYVTNGAGLSVTGDGYSGVLFAHSQIEASSHASSFIATSGSTATRAAESLSMIDESIFEGGEHSVYWEGTVNGSTADPRLMELSDGTSANRIQLFHNDGNKVMLRTTESGATQASIQISELMAGNSKVVATLKASEARLVRNGSTITSSTVDSFYSPPGLRKINIGTNYTQGGQLDGHVKRVAYYNTALTQTQAEALTS